MNTQKIYLKETIRRADFPLNTRIIDDDAEFSAVYRWHSERVAYKQLESQEGYVGKYIS